MRPWTERDDEILKLLYPKHSVSEIAFVMDRTLGAIRSRSSKLELKKERLDLKQFLKLASNEELSNRQIAEALSIHYCYVSILRRKYNVLRKPCRARLNRYAIS